MGRGDLIRVFIAVELPDDVQLALAAQQDELRLTGAHVKWVDPANIHLTIAFLGDIPPGRIEPVGEALDTIAATARPFPVEVCGLGTFGRGRTLRVVWAGIREETGSLDHVYTRVFVALADAGIHLEDRPFRPHLTLGRVRSPRGADELRHAAEEGRDGTFGFFEVSRLVLMQSHLTPAGPEYTTLHVAHMP